MFNNATSVVVNGVWNSFQWSRVRIGSETDSLYTSYKPLNIKDCDKLLTAITLLNEVDYPLKAPNVPTHQLILRSLS
ncbi:hypothetical protein BPOR_0839g00020 [Botrytis porri]|uniref:Uncharacterized protein n=1 Tax=Botrytis porri TaxID=87229 RepID=A0A4Z1K9Q5_9HELO|nr:hypothetical protein BPOR_0839g00020 [Botrytis porri]